MSTERDTERLLRQWLDEGPNRAADRLLETVEERIDRQRQRPAWRLSWRNLFMNCTIGSFAAGMAVVAVALIGFNVVSGRGTENGGVGGPAEPSRPPSRRRAHDLLAIWSEAPASGDGGLAVSFEGSLPEGWSHDEDGIQHVEDEAGRDHREPERHVASGLHLRSGAGHRHDRDGRRERTGNSRRAAGNWAEGSSG